MCVLLCKYTFIHCILISFNNSSFSYLWIFMRVVWRVRIDLDHPSLFNQAAILKRGEKGGVNFWRVISGSLGPSPGHLVSTRGSALKTVVNQTVRHARNTFTLTPWWVFKEKQKIESSRRSCRDTRDKCTAITLTSMSNGIVMNDAKRQQEKVPIDARIVEERVSSYNRDPPITWSRRAEVVERKGAEECG